MSNYYNRQWRLPNAWNGTESNVNKQSNYSLDFTSPLAKISFSPSINLGTTNTISMWVNFNSGYSGTLLGETSYSSQSFIFAYSSFLLYIGSTLKVFGSVASALTSGSWHHLVIVRTGDSVEIYVDNTSIQTQTGYGTSTDTKFDTIGSYPSGHQPIEGLIDSIACFNYALSASQITTLYGSSSTGIGNPMSLSPKPVAYYPLGDQDAFNGSNYLVPNSSLKDFVFDFSGALGESVITTSSYMPTSNFTVSLWFKHTMGGRDNYMFAIPKVNNVNTSFWIYTLSGNVRASISTNTNNADCEPSVTVNDGKWHQITATFDSSGNLKCFIDGSNETTSPQSPLSGTVAYGDNIGIGGYWTTAGSSNRAFDGEISNVLVLDTVLTATEAQTLYNNGSPIQTLSDIPQNSNLQGWWKLDASATYDSSTTTWTIPDDSTNSNDGTSSGMTQANLVVSDLSYKSGFSPFALDFDGTDDYIDVSNVASDLQSLNTLSISFWANNTQVSNYNTLNNAFTIITGTDANKSLAILPYDYYSTTGNNDCRIYYNGANIIQTGNSSLTGWNHFCYVQNGATDHKIYINGVSVGTSTTSKTLDSGLDTFRIGGFTSWGQYFDGSISNISIWNTALSSSQVTEIYNEAVPSNLNNHSAYSNLVSWWQLGSNTSWVDPYWIALDEKGTNNGESQNVAAPNNMGENAIVDGVGSYANGLSNGMSDNIVGSAPFSDANSLSVNMDVLDRTEDTPA